MFHRPVRKALALAGALLVSSAPLPALAQARDMPENQIIDHGTGYVNTTAAIYRAMQQRSQIEKGYQEPQRIDVSLVHEKYMEPGQFGLRLTVPEVMSGCWEVSPLEHEAKFVEPYYLDIRVKRYKRTLTETRHPQYECPKGNKVATTTVLLNRRDLEEKEIKKIRFKSAVFGDTYEIVYRENSLELVPESMVAFKARNLGGPDKDRLVMDFDRVGALALHVPLAEYGEDVGSQVRRIAYAYDLIPLDDPPPSRMYRGLGQTFHFADAGSGLPEKIKRRGYYELGMVRVERPYDSPRGRTHIPVDLRVFVTDARQDF